MTPRIRQDDILLVTEAADTGTVLELPCGCRYRYRVHPERGVAPVRVGQVLHAIAVDASDFVSMERTTDHCRMYLNGREAVPVAECLRARTNHGGHDA
jgi:hypothetical protein